MDESDREHRRRSVFINYNKGDRDPATKLSVINKHASVISHRKRHIKMLQRPEAAKQTFLPRTRTAAGSQYNKRKHSGNSRFLTSDEGLDEPHLLVGGLHSEYSRDGQLRQVNRTSKTPSNWNIGHPPGDAFGLLPIKADGHVPTAYESFTQVYIPLVTKSAGPEHNARAISSGFQICVQVALQDAMLFEQFMAYSLAMQSLKKDVTTRLTGPVLYHSNRSIARLRRRLQSESYGDSTDNVVLMTIVVLTRTFHTCGEHEAASIHVQALKRIITLRGGYSNLGWDGVVAMKAKQ
jgi:hypothetical protein